MFIEEFTELGGNEELPLGEEFQTLVKVFIDLREKKAEKRYELLAVLIEQLQYVFLLNKLVLCLKGARGSK